MPRTLLLLSVLALSLFSAEAATAETRIRIMPPDGGILAGGQRVDIRVEADSDSSGPPRGLRVTINGRDVTAENILDPGIGGERGAGGTGATGTSLPAHAKAGPAPATSTNFLLRDFHADTPGPLVIEARTGDGASRRVRLTVEGWSEGGRPRARNIILLLGDGMGVAHRTAARIVSRGVRNGKAAGRLAMDTLDVTGIVMTGSLNSVITDSSPGMAAYSTGQKSNNNQEGVFPDNTPDVFDNPRIEYLGELLRRTRGSGFNVGIVTSADVTDSTPGANAAHTSDRFAGARIAAQFFDERQRNGIAVLLGGGARHFMPKAAGGGRTDGRRLADEFADAGFARISSGTQVRDLLDPRAAPPKQILGLFHSSHMVVAFDKVGAGRYSDELAKPANAAYRDTPALEEMADLALRSLAAHSPAGFYLLIEGASIDKRAHAVDAERTVWDIIEFDRAVQVALDFAQRTNRDSDPDNDTLVIVTADHETGGLALIAVGNERYEPTAIGRAVRDYAAVFRFEADQRLEFFPNYVTDEKGYPVSPDPSRKLLLGWAAAPDHFENWLSNRLQAEAAVTRPSGPSVANPERDGPDEPGDNESIRGTPVPGFLVAGTIENGATPCPAEDKCPADTAAIAHVISGHTASDVPLSASGPGAWQFTGVYENTDVFLKILRSATGSYPRQP
ncbi:MAG TPA: alkaline phosphatase [Vicinamibacterales bacterium]|nr:alkaline phosphatase [Vicinamibacterales bacterium]